MMLPRFDSTGRFSVTIHDVTSGSSSLTIDSVQLQDHGYYTCSAESTHESNYKTFRMTVFSTSIIFYPRDAMLERVIGHHRHAIDRQPIAMYIAYNPTALT